MSGFTPALLISASTCVILQMTSKVLPKFVKQHLLRSKLVAILEVDPEQGVVVVDGGGDSLGFQKSPYLGHQGGPRGWLLLVQD